MVRRLLRVNPIQDRRFDHPVSLVTGEIQYAVNLKQPDSWIDPTNMATVASSSRPITTRLLTSGTLPEPL